MFYFVRDLSLADVGRQILMTADPCTKTSLTHAARQRWNEEAGGNNEMKVGKAEVPE